MATVDNLVIVSAPNGQNSAANALKFFETSDSEPALAVEIRISSGFPIIGVDPMHRGASHSVTPDDLDFFTLPSSPSSLNNFVIVLPQRTRSRLYAYVASSAALFQYWVREL